MHRQHGTISNSQAIGAGLSAEQVLGLLRAGAWLRPTAGVYRSAEAPETDQQRVWLALLAAGRGAVVSHHSAAALWGLDGAALLPVHVTIPPTRSTRRPGNLVIAHRSRDMRNRYATNHLGYPVTDPARTIIDVAGIAPAGTVARYLDDARGRRVTSDGDVRKHLDEVARQGRRGVRTVRRLLDERAGTRLHESALEGRFARLLRRMGIELPVAQFEVRSTNGELVARVDFAFPELRLAIELDGYRWHSDPMAFRRDRQRRRRLSALGWTVLEFTWEDLNEHPETVVREILAHVRRLSA